MYTVKKSVINSINRIARVVILSLLFFVLSDIAFASGKKEQIASDFVVEVESVGNSDAPIKLRALIGYWNTLASNLPSARVYYETSLRQWAIDNPDVYLEVEIIPREQTDQMMNRLLASAVAEQAPDFANVDGLSLGKFHEAGVLSPIDAYITDEERAQFFDFTKTVTNRGGKQYAVWTETGALLYYYNKKYVSIAPRSWGDLFFLSERLQTQNERVIPFLSSGQGEEATFSTFLPYFWGQGGKLFDPDNNYRPIFGVESDREAMINTFAFIQQLVDTKTIVPAMLEYTHDQLLTEALSDNVATMVAGSWIYRRILNNVPISRRDDWAYVSVPQQAIVQQGNISGGWTFAFFSKDSGKLQAAVDFVRAIYFDAEAMAGRSSAQGYVPTRRDAFESAPFDSPFYQVVKKELEISSARPASSLYSTVSGYIQETLGKIISGATVDLEIEIDAMYEKALEAWQSLQ